MPNKPVPPAAVGVSKQIQTLLLEGIDQLCTTRCAIDLVWDAMDGMGSDRQANAIHYGVSQIRKELITALETIEAAHRLHSR